MLDEELTILEHSAVEELVQRGAGELPFPSIIRTFSDAVQRRRRLNRRNDVNAIQRVGHRYGRDRHDRDRHGCMGDAPVFVEVGEARHCR